MAYSFNTELKNVAGIYIKLRGIKIPQTHLKNSIEESPFYPSLLTLNDVFNGYQIENAAYRVPREDLLAISDEVPFVAFMRTENNDEDFVIVNHITEDKISIIHRGKTSRVIGTEDFLNRFKEVVWSISDQAIKTNPKLENQFKAEKHNDYLRAFSVLVIVASLFSFFGLTELHKFLEVKSLYFFIKLFGLLIAGLLVAYELDKNNSFVKNLCAINSKTNCDAILSSEASKIFGVTWSEIGFTYFLGTMLILSNMNLDINVRLTVTSILSCCASTYIIFSLYYQWKIVKQWCPLCLVIQSVLFLELMLSVYMLYVNQFSAKPSAITLVILAASFVFSIAFLFLIKPIYIRSSEHSLFRSAYRRLQYNPDIFNILLSKQDLVPKGWESMGIDIGNPDAKNTIIKICNPFCGPCSASHLIIHDTITSNSNIKLKIIYTSVKSTNSLAIPVIKHFLAIRDYYGPEILTQAVHYWYSNKEKNFKTFSTKFDVPEQINTSDTEVDLMREWCVHANVSHTPTIFFNGYKLPENYKIEDLSLIM